MTGLDRKMIVKLTAGYDEKLPGGARFTPRPVDSRRLIMTALGGTLDADRRWKTRPAGVDLLAWIHRLSRGRDSYVRVEYARSLFPVGHAATLVKLSQRKFQWREKTNSRDRVAILRQRFFIVVREKIRAYPNAAPQPDLGRIEGTLVHFRLNLVCVLIVHFDRLRFLKTSGRKPDVDIDLNLQPGVTFGGPLEFINKLKDYIPSNAFSDPPDPQITPAGITAGYSLGLPAIQRGILSLSNITLGAAFTLPFNGDAPTARFNFAERHNTFNLTVSLIGGGGFLAVVVGTDGVREIEAALEFGAQIAINLGVASGSVYIKGGFSTVT